MQLLATESQAMIADSTRRLFNSYPIELRRKQWQGDWLKEAYDRLGEAGMLQLADIPGGDLEAIEYLLTFGIELGRSVIMAPFLASALAAGCCLKLAGRDDAAEGVLDGSAIEVMALGEAAGSLKGTFNPGTSLENNRLKGTKCAISFAQQASGLILTAKDGDGTLHLVRVATADPGVVLAPLETVAGEPLYEVSVDCPFADEDILASGTECVSILREMLTRIFMVQSAIIVGGAERALEIVTAHVIERHQFDQPLGAFQAVQHHIANSRIHLDAARLMTFETGWRYAEGHADMLAWAAETKSWVSASMSELLRRAHELQGGISVTDEHETMLLLRRNLAESVSWGCGSDLLKLAYPLRSTPPTVQPLFEELA